MSVNICGDITFFRIAVDLDINGIFQIVPEDQVEITAGHGRIIGQRNIGYRKSVIITLHDLDLCPEQRVVEGGGHLADTAADPRNHLIIYENARHGISVIILDRIYRIVGGNLFSRIYYLSVHQLRGTGDILIPSRIT